MKALILSFLLSLPVFHEDVGDPRKQTQLEQVADAIDKVAADRQEAAMLVATGYQESRFGLRWHQGVCRGTECDRGRARGPWQVQRFGMSRVQWNEMIGVQNTEAQARMAQRRLMIGQAQCHGSPYGAMARYLGLPCYDRTWKVKPRLSLYERALLALTPTP